MKLNRKVILVILDGLGVGAMADAPPADRAANTLLHVNEVAGPLELPTLIGLGLGKIVSLETSSSKGEPDGAYGTAQLGYTGADTFLGHQKLIGRSCCFELHLLADARDKVIATLESAGHRVESMSTLGVPLLVDECAVVADNVEALRGMSINVTASLASVDFDELLAIGRLVRQVVEVPRVIVLAGRGFDVATMRGHLVETSPGQVGINTPGLGLYDENYRVRQLGARGNNETDLTSLVRDEGGSVVLLGKAADVIECEGAEKEPLVQTAQVLERALEHLVEMKTGLVVANVQETDLAGHEQDALRFGKVLVEADAFLAPIVRALGPDDMLIVTADHGNDPLSGNSQHTREAVPLLLAGARIQVGSFGERRSLADVGSTIGRFLSLPSLVEGTSLGEEVVRCS